jgi:hypothetical protein
MDRTHQGLPLLTPTFRFAPPAQDSQPRFRESVPILGALVDRLDDSSSHVTQAPDAVPDDVVNDVNAVESTVTLAFASWIHVVDFLCHVQALWQAA